MFLYNLTLSRASGIQCAVYGNFSGPKAQEIVVSRGKVLELLRPDETGRLQTILSTEVFGTVRSLAPFRLTGAKLDYLIVGSDSGRIVILEYNKDRNAFKKVHQETFGKSGCRRIVPGQLLAVDPKGRACLIAASEKQKLVYVLNRDAAANLTISSPLEAHKSHHLCFAVTGLDMGFDNPVFAAIELDYADADQDPSGDAASEAQKHLVLYELDLGLNHVIRKWSEPVDNGANLLIPVPGGGDGPGGVLICAENFVIYKNQDHPDVRAVLPRRSSLANDRGVLIIATATHRTKSEFFIFVQSEYGDIYRVSLKYAGESVAAVAVKYFDTIAPCASMCVLKSGMLFAGSESGNHALYQFLSIDDKDGVESSSDTITESEQGFMPVYFEPRALRNLQPVDQPDSLAPITDMKVANLANEEIPQIYAVCGQGPRSSLRVLRPGLAIAEMAVSPLPGNPTGVWTVRKSVHDDYDGYIVVSFANATLVLSIGETVEEVNDSGFLGTVPTIRTQLLEDSSLIQVHPGGMRHIRAENRIQEWRAPGHTSITRATSNSRQVIVALSGGSIVFFELQQGGSGILAEFGSKALGAEIKSLDVPPVPQGRLGASFLALGFFDSTIRILSLGPEDTLEVKATQMTNSPPESLLLLDTPAAAGPANPADDDSSAPGALFLHAGLANGVLLRSEVDRVTGSLSDTRTRFLGTRPAQLVPFIVGGQRSMLALSSRPWLGYAHMGRYTMTPLSYEALEAASSFSSDQCVEGICAVAKNSLRILTIERLGETFNQQALQLRYTPRRFVIHPDHKTLMIAEADHAAIPASEREPLAPLENGAAMSEDGQPLTPEVVRAQEDAQMGAPRGAQGQWASCLRVVDPATLSTASLTELEFNEAAVSLCLVRFNSAPQLGTVLAVGTVQSLTFYPREVKEGFIRLYQVLDNGRRLSLVHRTPVGGIPGALSPFKGRLLAGVGSALRIYDAGKKKLLRKTEYKGLPTHVATLSAMGERIFAGDLQESFHYLRYKSAENSIYSYADDAVPRHITSALPLDYDTIAGGDKFGNLFVVRLPSDVSAQVEEDPTGGKFAGSTGQLNGAPHKLEDVINFHVGDLVTAIQRCTLQPGGQEVLLYCTIMGSIGALVPFTSREDVDFFQHLEMHLRQEHPPLAGRDHLAFRGSYLPIKDVIDGDLCEQFSQVPLDKQKAMAEELDRTPGEVLKKLEDLRNKLL
ncbi:hypothetical protein WJX73_002520 [Symbiochloris irregularis]|uniref:Splicing factor 3B subunit 3 n=1 Tax=Symbiochloris irregularis TaxID=706552 RepID=A0AAW1Q3K8_9CHLO